MKKSLLALCVVCFVAACPGFNSYVSSHSVEARLVTKAVTAEYLTRHPEAGTVVVSFTTSVLAILNRQPGEEQVSLAALDRKVGELVQQEAAGLTPEGRAALVLLVTEIKAALKQELARKGVVAPDEVVLEVKAVVTWVNEVAVIYAGGK